MVKKSAFLSESNVEYAETYISADYSEVKLAEATEGFSWIEMLREGKESLQAPWLGFTGFFTIATMLTLLVFIGEAVRDALDPRKTFR